MCRVVGVFNSHVVSAGAKDDVLFHFGLSTASHDLRQMFADVKVCTLLITLAGVDHVITRARCPFHALF